MAVELTIDGKNVEAERDEILLLVARRRGARIPTLCHHDAVAPLGACRLCLVEIERQGRTRIATSCNYPVRGGEVVRTDTEKIRKLRRTVIELLLPLAPDAKVLLELAREYGASARRFSAGAKRLDCILCGLCTRVCAELAHAGAIDFCARGGRKRLTTPFGEDTPDCIGCGACSEVCPTGTITMETAAVRRLKESPGARRWCRYHLMGMAPAAVCPMSYDCSRCEIDQGMRSLHGGHPLIASALRRKAEGRTP
jgi:bidirectional [NiFe] hydrogenase diaphorase subunit